MLADLRKIASQSFIYGLGTMAPKLAGFILIPIYTKHFPLSEFGILGLLDSTSQIIIGIVGLALYQGFFRWYFDKQAETKKKSLFFTLLLVHVILAFISVIIIWPFGTYISTSLFGHSGYTHVLRLMVITSLIQMIVIMPSTLLRLQERAGLYTISNLLQMAVMVIITVYLIVFQHMGVEAIYYAQLIGLISYLLLLIRYIIVNCEVRFEWTLLKQIISFCLPLVLSSIAIVLLNQADRYVINHFDKLGDVGLYTLGFRLSNTLNILLVASISFAIQPMIFKKMDDPNNKRFYSKLLTYFVLVVMFFVLGMTFFGKEIVKLFANRQEYYEAYQIIPILCFAILFNMMKDMAMIGLQITKKTHSIAGIVITVSVTGILLNILLVPWLHNFGAAIAKLVASILFFWLIYYYSQKAYPIQYEMKKLLMMILIGAILYLPVIFINEMGILIRILVKTLLIFSYPVLLYLMGFFEPVELEKLQGAWTKWKHPAELLSNLKALKK
ncbi:MAG: oligosaccharide flippase family protein [Bacteroidetes bacterium]|nr:oligosaccharide flippase family protein [Bacteroidota bacterium]